MMVYHGSVSEVKHPILNKGRVNLDFGQGFYVTTLKTQAEKWAHKRAAIRKSKAIVSCYEFSESGLKTLKFLNYNREWLEYIIKNRSIHQNVSDYDAVYGFIADDDVAAAIDQYMYTVNQGKANEITTQALLHELSFAVPNNQYCVKTERALANLRFIESYEVL